MQFRVIGERTHVVDSAERTLGWQRAEQSLCRRRWKEAAQRSTDVVKEYVEATKWRRAILRHGAALHARQRCTPATSSGHARPKRDAPPGIEPQSRGRQRKARTRASTMKRHDFVGAIFFFAPPTLPARALND